MFIERYCQDLGDHIQPKKVLVIYGSRQVGKTTLLNSFLSHFNHEFRLDSGDNIKIQQVLGSQDFDLIKEYAAGYKLLVIDEAQRIPGIGMGLKILIDQVPDIQIIATGSSSFELAGEIGEPLTGRKTTLTLFPISQMELTRIFNPFELKDKLENWLVFGSYPEIVTTEGKNEKAKLLEEIMNSYLLKDILELEKVKSSKVLVDLLRLLAFQIGNEVSLTELGSQLGIDYKTVARYLDLLEKTFIIFNLRGFSRNLRSEITKKGKYYFYDTGIRNAVISNFNDVAIRNDAGLLWENFLMIERLKKRAYQNIYANEYFWRTWEQKEIDLVEEREGKLFAYEFKWGNTKVKKPKLWAETYPESEFSVIDQSNYLDFIT